MAKIVVQNTPVTVISVNGEDYICLTDMIRAKDGDFFITDWLRNRNTLEFIGIWEKVYNPNFNYGEFATIRNQSGLNSFKISFKNLLHVQMQSVCKLKLADMEAPMLIKKASQGFHAKLFL